MWKEEGSGIPEDQAQEALLGVCFHLINNFLITHKPILKRDALFFLFLPDIYFRHFECWNMPLIWKMWP